LTETTSPILAYELPALRRIGVGRAAAGIGVASAAVFAFLFWLVYFKPAAGYTSAVIGYLPAVNAGLNFLSAAFLLAGFVAIRRRNFVRHAKLMFAALTTSALFFVSYVVYHNFHGDTKFLGQGLIRPAYFFILISHIVLSGIAVPLILGSFFLSLSGKLRAHRVLSRVTLPIWLYVSVTGVLIFVLLKAFNG
jgi:putative membrane protein